MIVAVGSDKGAPGVTTLATVLGVVWPMVWQREAGVLEADPSGADLTFRLRPASTPDLEFLAPEPSLFSLAADARTGLGGSGLGRYGQDSTIGVRVIPGPIQAEQFVTVHPVWPALAQTVAGWPQVVLADLGRLQPGHAAWPLAQAATAVLILARPSVEGLYHLRERVRQVASALGDDRLTRNPVAVVVLAGAREYRSALQQVEYMLAAAGSPIPVAGWMADDPATVSVLHEAGLSRAVRASALLRSVTDLAATLGRLWPQLGAAGSPAVPAVAERVLPVSPRAAGEGFPVGHR